MRRRGPRVEWLERRQLLAADWQNPLLETDVNDDTFVAPIDALLVINELNGLGPRPLTTPPDITAPTIAYLDVSGDRFLAPIDALLVINRLNEPPGARGFSVELLNDSGRSATDLVTNDARMSGQVTQSAEPVTIARGRFNRGSVFPITVNAAGQFQLDSAAVAALSDGSVRFSMYVRDASGADAVRRVQFQLDTVAPAASFDLTPSSDSGAVGDFQTAYSRVTLRGATEPGADVQLLPTNVTTIVSNAGDFYLPNIHLPQPSNDVTVRATDAAGNVRDTSHTIIRLDDPLGIDPVLDWNLQALESIRLDAATPPEASRILAIVHSAIFDVVSAIDGTPGRYVTMPTPPSANIPVAIAVAAHRVLLHAYPAQQSALDAKLAEWLSPVPAGDEKLAAVSLAGSIADAMIALREGDGYDAFTTHPSHAAPGGWQETAPIFEVALDPHWGDVEPFVANIDSVLPAGPPELTSQQWAAAFNEVKQLGAAQSAARTAEQTQIARFWADGKGTYTPPGHWNQIAAVVAQDQAISVTDSARLFAQLNTGLADAAIASWKSKYATNFWRPITAIHDADLDGNHQTTADPTWEPFLITPPFPEYTSGHSTFSGVAAEILNGVFGSDVPFSVNSFTPNQSVRNFASFDAAAAEASFSRVLGGIHYRFSGEDGLATGRLIGQQVLTAFSTSVDLQPPSIIVEAIPDATAANFELRGQVFDNLAGLQDVTWQVDDGAASPLVLDAAGHFAVTSNFALDGTSDGQHTFMIRAVDAAGNVRVSQPTTVFDTQAPLVVLDGLENNQTIDHLSRLAGHVDGTGTPITGLTYSFAGQAPVPITVSADGSFDSPLDLSHLSRGSQTFSLRATDAAQNSTTTTLTLNLPVLAPFAITQVSPTDGAVDVGTTYRPQVYFSRPVNPVSLNADNFYATDPAGAKLPATIVSAADGSFAWLFLANPLPGGARVTVHVHGESILAAADNVKLDADVNGATGGQRQFSYTTVSLAPLLGTSLVGKVLDVGPDLNPMTYDDIRAGADQTLHTTDDVYLLPLAGVKVFIVGLENQFALTDSQGAFHFDAVPTGNVKFVIDGTTATNAPADFYFPEMVMDLNLEPGRANTVMGTMSTGGARNLANRDRPEVYLPRLRTSLLQDLSPVATTLVGVNPESAPDLTADEQGRLTIEVPAGSLIDANGNVMAMGQIGMSTVAPELVREMLPPGLLQLATTMTIQAPGVAVFASPLRLTYPNVYGAAPGSKLDFYSFDHTTGRLVIEGTATVSEDGLSVTTDPDSGVKHPGWHGFSPPGGDGYPDGFSGDLRPLDLSCLPGECIEADPVVFPMIDREALTVLQHPNLKWVAPDLGTLDVSIEVDGPLGEFMKRTGNVPLTSSSFSLSAGARVQKVLSGASKTYDQLVGHGGFAAIEGDRLYGARIKVTEALTKGSRTTVTTRVFYLYRWVSATYAPEAQSRSGNSAAFLKTLADGPGNWSTFKQVEARLPTGVTTQFQVTGGKEQIFQVKPTSKGKDLLVWKFDPVNDVPTDVPMNLTVSDRNLQVGTVRVRGRGVEPVGINIDVPGYVAELRRVILELVDVWAPGPDFRPGRANVDDDGDSTVDNLEEHGWPGSDDVRFPTYAYSKNAPGVPFPYQLLDLRGPAIGTGQTTVKQFVVDPGLPRNRRANVGPSFFTEFRDFMPSERTTPTGVDGYWMFSPQQLAQLDIFLAQKGEELRQAVADDYLPVNGGLNAYTFVTTGGQVTMKWHDTFVAADGSTVAGTNVTGSPLYGFADFDADMSCAPCGPELGHTDSNSDGISMEPIFKDPKIPSVAKQWTLAEELNPTKVNDGNFGVAINMLNKSTANFAKFVANSVSHEVAHTFGVNDAYVNRFTTPGTAGCLRAQLNAIGGNCRPYDIMRLGLPNDPDLTFAPGNISILRAAMGIAPDRSLEEAVRQYRDTFHLAASSVGIRETSIDPDAEVILSPILVARTDSAEWYADEDGPTLSLDATAADGPGGQQQTQVVTIHNPGTAPLDVASIALTGAPTGFQLVGTAQAIDDVIPPNESVAFSVVFDPVQLGVASDEIRIAGGDTATGIVRIRLTSESVIAHPEATVPLESSGNFGGVVVGTGGSIRAAMVQIANTGRQPLEIRSVRGGVTGAFRLLDVPPDLASNPVILAPGGSWSVGASFNPFRPGLDREIIEVDTNDPLRPTLRLSLTGTGLATATTPAHWGRDYVAFADPENPNGPVLRAVSDDAGFFRFFVPPDAFFHVVVFDPVTGLVGVEDDVTAPSGQRTTLASTMVFQPSLAPDADADGLPDDIELAIGTARLKIDSDRDGIDDYNEVMLGLNPLDGVPAATGVISAVSLPGGALDVVVAAQLDRPDRRLAYVASSVAGLSIVDVSRPFQPVQIAQLPLPGNSNSVTIDAAEALVAVSSIDGGLHLVDVSDPDRPALLRTIAAVPTHCVLFDGIAYVDHGSVLRAYDVDTGDLLKSLEVGHQVAGLSRSGNVLYLATTATQSLLAIDIANGAMTILDSISVVAPPKNLFVADGKAWVSTTQDFAVVDVSTPNDLQIVGFESALNNANSFVLNGSGLGVSTGLFALAVVGAQDPAQGLPTVTLFTLPAFANSAVVAAGLAYVADSGAGLQIVNFLAFDQGTVPPAVTVDIVSREIDDQTPGWQFTPGSTVQLSARVTDDVQVDEVELLVNGVVVDRDMSYPFDLSSKLPVVHEPGINATLQVRATDTGGNSRLSEPIVVDLIPDLTPPAIQQFIPPTSLVSRIGIQFSEALDPSTVTAANFTLLGPNGPVDPITVRLRQNGAKVDLRYPLLPDGEYSLVMRGAFVTDLVGNPLGAGNVVREFQLGNVTTSVTLAAGRLTFTGHVEVSGGQLRAVADFNGDSKLDIAGPFGYDSSYSAPVLLGQGDGSFRRAPVVDLPELYLANAVVAGDFNADQKWDLVAAQRDASIVILLGNGDGTFGAGTVISNDQTGRGTTMAVGDFNNDDIPDLVTGHGGKIQSFTDPRLSTDGFVFVALGNGDGTFTPATEFAFLFKHSSLLAIDMDKDGNLDLVGTNGPEGANIDGVGNTFQVLRGLGNGRFEKNASGNPLVRTTPVPAGVHLAAVADLNGDNKLDAAVTGQDSVSVLLGNGDGSFQTPVVYPVPGAWDVIATDYTGDNRPELVVTNTIDRLPSPSLDRGSVSVLINQGNGAFNAPVEITGVSAPLHLASGHFNTDGRMDLLLTIQDQGVTVLSGVGNGSFHTPTRYGIAAFDNSLHTIDVVKLADVNKDGFDDIIASDRTGGAAASGIINVLLGNGDKTFQPLRSFPVSLAPVAIAIGDLDLDDDLDLVVASTAAARIDILLGDGTGDFQHNGSLIDGVSDVVLADFNGDDRLDLVAGQAGVLGVAFYRGLGNGTFGPRSFITLTHTSDFVEAGDFNRDGELDIAVLQQKTNGDSGPAALRILIGTGEGTFGLAPNVVDAPIAAASLTVSDVDRDQRLDLIVGADWYTRTGSGGGNEKVGNTVTVFRGIGDHDANFHPAASYGDYGWGYFEVVATDLNGDGYPDFVASTMDVRGQGPYPTGYSHGLAVLMNDGAGVFGTPVFFDHASGVGGGIAVGDVNDDEKLDVVTANYDSNTISILYGRSTGSQGGQGEGESLADQALLDYLDDELS